MSSTNPLVRFRKALDRAAAATRTTILAETGSIASAPQLVRGALNAPPGSRCVVVATATSAAARRAGIVPHHLRKAGYLPLVCELPDAAPIAQSVSSVVEAARRTGSDFVVAYGSPSTLSIGRAAALVAANGGRVKDYASNVGGKLSPSKPSLPFLAVPSCPGGGEFVRESRILCDGFALGSLRSHPSSVQATVIDPGLAVAPALVGNPALRTGYATLIHAIEAYIRNDSDPVTRQGSWLAVQLAAHFLPITLTNPSDIDARAGLALASALTSAALATGPLGPCRGIALTVASRYRVPYTAAITAVAPEVLGGLGEFLEAKLEEEEEEEGEGEGEESGARSKSEMAWSDNLESDSAENARKQRQVWNPKTPFMERPSATNQAKSMKGKAASGKNKGDKDDADSLADAKLERTLTAYAKEAEKEMLDPAVGAQDSEVKLAVRRLRQVVHVLKQALGGNGSSASDITESYPSLGSSSSSSSSSVSELGDLLLSMRRVMEGKDIEMRPPSLAADYKIPEAELRLLADAAEVDEDTLSCLVQLRSADILDMLKRS